MDNKILVEVKVPIIDEEYNIFIPVSKTVYKVVELIEQSIIEFSDGAYKAPVGRALYDAYGKQINPNSLIKDSGIKNGAKLILL